MYAVSNVIIRTSRTRSSTRVLLQHRRAGASFIELFVALLVLGTLLGLLVPTMRRVETARRNADLRRVASLELSNLMEELSSRPAERLTPEELQKLQLSDAAKLRLPDASLTSSTASTDAKGLVKVQLSVSWPSMNGQATEPVRLTTWLRGPK